MEAEVLGAAGARLGRMGGWLLKGLWAKLEGSWCWGMSTLSCRMGARSGVGGWRTARGLFAGGCQQLSCIQLLTQNKGPGLKGKMHDHMPQMKCCTQQHFLGLIAHGHHNMHVHDAAPMRGQCPYMADKPQHRQHQLGHQQVSSCMHRGRGQQGCPACKGGALPDRLVSGWFSRPCRKG